MEGRKTPMPTMHCKVVSQNTPKSYTQLSTYLVDTQHNTDLLQTAIHMYNIIYVNPVKTLLGFETYQAQTTATVFTNFS